MLFFSFQAFQIRPSGTQRLYLHVISVIIMLYYKYLDVNSKGTQLGILWPSMIFLCHCSQNLIQWPYETIWQNGAWSYCFSVSQRFSWYFVFDSESTLKEQLDKEKAALQQSVRKNSALISEKDQQVENLKSEVRIACMMAPSYCRWVWQIMTKLLSMHHINLSK